MARRLRLRFFLDHCVPASVGRVLEDAGHEVIYQKQAIAEDAKDEDVAIASVLNDAILITYNRKHYRALATRAYVSNRRLKKLSRIDFKCIETEAAKRIQDGLSLIESEWRRAQKVRDPRIFIEVQKNAFKTLR